jgi:rhodanese-related sulfurtransferase
MNEKMFMESLIIQGVRRSVICVMAVFIALLLFSPLNAEGKAKWQKISVKEAFGLYKLRQAHLVNTMSHLECMDHRIPGSLCLACEEIEKSPQILPPDKTSNIIFYCESDNCYKSCLAAYVAVRNGYANVFVLEGGLPAWKQAGHEVESVQRIPRVAVKSIKIDTLRSWLAERKTMSIIDIRTENNFKEGHIEGAVNLPLYKLHERYQELPYNRMLVLVDSRGFRSFLAQSYLKRKGFDVVRLFGGMEAWKVYESRLKKERAR